MKKTFIILLLLSSILKAQTNNNIFLGGSYGGGISSCTPVELPLPVEFLWLKAEAADDESKVLVTWSTALEFNNDYFVIQKSTDGHSFKEAGLVYGSGTSTVVNKYSFADTEPMAGVSFYRLKQVDFNSVFTYTKIVQVEINSEQRGEIVYYDILGNIVAYPISSQMYFVKQGNSVKKIIYTSILH